MEYWNNRVWGIGIIDTTSDIYKETLKAQVSFSPAHACITDVCVSHAPSSSLCREMAAVEQICCICNATNSDNLVNVTKKGTDTLLRYCKKNNRSDVSKTICSLKKISMEVYGHSNCRSIFTNPKRKRAPPEKFVKQKRIRSDATYFDWKKCCLYCFQQRISEDGNEKVRKVQTIEIRELILRTCEERADSWGEDVQRNVMNCSDLIAAEAVYHKSCHRDFFFGKASFPCLASGRYEDEIKSAHFENTCQWLELNGDLIKLNEAYEYMINITVGQECYSQKRFRQKLKEKYGKNIVFHDSPGCSPLIHFENLSNRSFEELYERRKECNDPESIVRLSVKLMQDQLRQMTKHTEYYPSDNDIQSIEKNLDEIPQLLKSFLLLLIPDKLKVASIGQSILQCIRPRSYISLIQLALGASLDNVFGSRWLIETLHKLGFCLGYLTVLKHKQSAVLNQKIDSFAKFPYPGHFTQWIADNVDHNLVTLNGEETFHGMGLISVSTKTTTDACAPIEERSLLKTMTRVSNEVIIEDRGIPIVCPPIKNFKLNDLKLRDVESLKVASQSSNGFNIDLAWHSIALNEQLMKVRPSWSGYMQNAMDGEYTGASKIVVLPLIDLKSSDVTCIYSTLLFIEKQAALLKIQTPCITFDQLLWQKATEICSFVMN